ncbi:hypothetical protein CY34DRAFT_801743 [Suillus luteus UH-Slu-Lm8-n1]|uniref:Uncharacterized protein n=1 Tax=Suillus luteus UH-Slu-Lm8-n1 TaxID=930992 RepID=A0A0D0A5I4_9AGAM|nr:hypothetical protein CY34DRAFT_801743 [Suillus luteus UH-Slu-Lm8-n1]
MTPPTLEQHAPQRLILRYHSDSLASLRASPSYLKHWQYFLHTKSYSPQSYISTK